MKIECDKCGAKYSIADEKVRGKTFKIRCKKCSNVIIVRDKVAAVAAGGGGAAEEEPAAAQPGWHLAINGETVGPMPDDEVRERYHAGEIDKDTAVWQEGFDDWVPLGDVDTFADLPERASAAAAPAEDPFASANQDDYAASAVAASSAAAAAMHAAPQAEPQSPRVSSLTGQRNENSVLFSLDSLQSLATGGGNKAASAPARASSGSRGLATAAPASEGSGLIDIRALGAMVGDEPQRAASSASPGAVDDAVLPSFGGAGLGGLASTPLVPQASPIEAAAVAAPPPSRSNAPLYAMMAILILAVLGLGAYVVLKEDQPVIVTQESTPAPSVKDAAKDEDEDEDKKKKDEDEDDEGEDKEEGGEEEGEAEAAEGGEGEEGGLAGKGTSGTKNRSKGGKKGSGGTTSKPPSGGGGLPLPDTTKKPDPPKPQTSDTSVDCILDPSKCKGGGGGGGGSKPKPSGATDPNLPEKLSTTDIKNGVNGVMAAAKACGSKHGAKPGETVKVRISISGASGTVSSATAQAPHQATPLGNCVAAAVKKATFKKFRSASMGAIYPFRM